MLWLDGQSKDITAISCSGKQIFKYQCSLILGWFGLKNYNKAIFQAAFFREAWYREERPANSSYQACLSLERICPAVCNHMCALSLELFGVLVLIMLLLNKQQFLH